jgi:hypothetical protein
MNCTVFIEKMIIGFRFDMLEEEKFDALFEHAKKVHGENIEMQNVDYHRYSVEAEIHLVLEYYTSHQLQNA